MDNERVTHAWRDGDVCAVSGVYGGLTRSPSALQCRGEDKTFRDTRVIRRWLAGLYRDQHRKVQ